MKGRGERQALAQPEDFIDGRAVHHKSVQSSYVTPYTRASKLDPQPAPAQSTLTGRQLYDEQLLMHLRSQT